MKLYVIKYCANEFDDLGYDSPYPIYYSLDHDDAYGHFAEFVNLEKKNFTEYLYKHPELKDNEDYSIEIDTENEFEFNFGKWFYKYVFKEAELEKDLRYENG